MQTSCLLIAFLTFFFFTVVISIDLNNFPMEEACEHVPWFEEEDCLKFMEMKSANSTVEDLYKYLNVQSGWQQCSPCNYCNNPGVYRGRCTGCIGSWTATPLCNNGYCCVWY
eukprot:TRINITY_DN5406_c0_g1_i1.p1 TRINITY_DN5406_c0_g1~~TRINITY_DN5406_c0_g1_i1.p1  ORF type:complete len:112 (+),score=27.68 TRINITY_DN5406_c0_g1_i1:164-499(+)